MMQVVEKQRIRTSASGCPRTLLNNHEGIIRRRDRAATMTFEILAAGIDFTDRHSPGSVTFGQQPSPRTAGTAKTLHKTQRAKNGNHPAFLNLDQRQQEAPASES